MARKIMFVGPKSTDFPLVSAHNEDTLDVGGFGRAMLEEFIYFFVDDEDG